MEASKLDVTILSRGITLLQLLGRHHRRYKALSARQTHAERLVGAVRLADR